MNNSKLATIRALLAKAEATEFPAEADAYNEKAAQLIAQYGIDAALLAESEPDADVVGDRIVYVDNPYGMDKVILLNVIAKAFRCRAVGLKPRRGSSDRRWALHLFGYGADLERVELLFTSLLLQAASGVKRVQSLPWLTASQKAADRRAWLAGFSTAVADRLEAAEEKAATDSGHSTEMVLVSRTARVETAVAVAYPNLTKPKRRNLSGGGYEAGHAAGTRADLGGTGVTGKGQRQL